jgi:hypothetical protein
MDFLSGDIELEDSGSEKAVVEAGLSQFSI